MKTLLVINPNTSLKMTKSIEKVAKSVVSSSFEVKVECVKSAPESLESYYDYTLAAIGLIEYVKSLDTLPDGILIACFGDPGLFELKELLEIPVIGIAEASLAMSALLGYNTGIIVASQKAVPMMWDMIQRYRFSNRVKSIKSLDMQVLNLEDDPEKTTAYIEKIIKQMKLEHVDVAVLGCAGFTALINSIGMVEKREKMPIIEPVSVGLKVLEVVTSLGLKHSKIGIFQKPFPKHISGFLSEIFGGVGR